MRAIASRAGRWDESGDRWRYSRRRRWIEAVKLADVIGLVGDVENFRRRRLHAIGQFVAANARVELALQRIFILMNAVVGTDQIELFAAIFQRVIRRQREIGNGAVFDSRALISRGK